MRFKRLIKKYSKYNLFILAVIFLLGFSIFYFLYYRVRSKVEIYFTVSLRQSLQSTSNWIPMWISDSINTGDRDASAVSGINAVVVDKETYSSSSYGDNVYLTLKANAIRDRSGTYLLKNKPLLVGSNIDLKLNKAQVYGVVTYIGDSFPKYEKKKLVVKVKGTQLESWIIEAVKIGSLIKNSKDEEEVKVVDKKVYSSSPIGMRYEAQTGRFVYSSDSERADLELTLEIMATKIGEEYYYAQVQRVKVNEWLTLPFNEVTINAPITSVSPI